MPHQNSHKIASKYIFDEYFLQEGVKFDIFDENDEILMKDKHLVVRYLNQFSSVHQNFRDFTP